GAVVAGSSTVLTRIMTFSGGMPSWPLSVPLERVLERDVDQADRQHDDERLHLDEAEHAEPPEEQRPGIEEHDLDVEYDEQDGGEVKLDREASPGGTAGEVAALERLTLHRRSTARPEPHRPRQDHAPHEPRPDA